MAKYSYEFKEKVVMEYLYGEGETKYLAKKYNIPSKTPIANWVNDFRKYGTDALKPHKKGRKKLLNISKGNSKVSKKEYNTDSNSEYLKELEDENLRLRIENAFLKEIRRLRLEEKALLKELRESSTDCEKNSD